MALKSVQ